MEAIQARLLKVRGTISKDELQKRLDTATFEVSRAPSFDHIVENKDGHFEEAVSKVIHLLGM
jgi:guanylate kinase